MKAIKKWRKNLQTIGFPNHEKYSDQEILQIIYKDVPERLALLKWIAVKISDEDPAKFNMTKEDVGEYFRDRGLLNPTQENDFMQARCSEKLQEDTWKLLFSFTRMYKFLNPPKTDRVGIQDKFSELLKSNYEERFSFLSREPSVTIEEVESEAAESDLDRIVEQEVSDIKNEMEKRANLKAKESEDQMKKELEVEELKQEVQRILGKDETKNEEKLKKIVHEELKPFTLPTNMQAVPFGKLGSENFQSRSEFYLVQDNITPIFSRPHSIEDINIYGNETERQEKSPVSSAEQFDKGKSPSKEWFRENDVIPRLFIMPGSPPLGHLDRSKIKIVAENSTTPITLEGKPYHNHSQWQYRVYEMKKGTQATHSNPLLFEEFKAADRLAHIGGAM